jgi:E3 ubiquitin-protein ligase HUWE1
MVLQAVMEREIIQWMASTRADRNVDMSAFLKNFTPVIMRDPDVFIQATEHVCRLYRSEPVARQYQMTLRKSEKGSTEPDPLSRHGSLMFDAVQHVDTAKMVVHYMLSELVSLKTSMSPSSSVENLTSLVQESSEAVVPAVAGAKDEATDKSAEEKHFHVCFLMQALAELFDAYPPCKLAVMDFSVKRAGKDASNRGPKTFMHFLIHDCLPYAKLQVTRGPETNVEVKKHLNESQWAMNLICAMCTGEIVDESAKKDSASVSEDATKSSVSMVLSAASHQLEYANLKKFALESIARAIKEGTTVKEPLEKKYGRYQALVDLISKLLSTKPVQSTNTLWNERPPTTEPSTVMAKLMMEKNFVPLLTNLLSDLDLNFPDVRALINATMKPLDQLTRLANKISRLSSVAPTPAEIKRHTLLDDVAGMGSGEHLSQQPQHPSDSFIRDSALGMFSTGRHDHMDSGSESDDEDEMLMGMEDDMEEGDMVDEFTDMSGTVLNFISK